MKQYFKFKNNGFSSGELINYVGEHRNEALIRIRVVGISGSLGVECTMEKTGLINWEFAGFDLTKEQRAKIVMSVR